MGIARRFIEGINATRGLEVWGRPVSNKFGYGSRVLDISAVADGLEARGWAIGRQQNPPGINMHISLLHAPVVERYLRDLGEVALAVATNNVEGSQAAATYN
jgi:sphinganine-1-phosphate aldolase